MISETKAIELARAACAGKADVPADVSPRATLEGRVWVVVFPTTLPAGTRGPDHHARVVLDGRTGEVIEILGGG